MRSAIETQSEATQTRDGRSLLRSGELGGAMIRLAELAAQMDREELEGRESPSPRPPRTPRTRPAEERS